MTRLRLPTYTVDLDELDEYVGDIGRIESRLQQVGDDLVQQITVLHEHWRGSGAEAQLEAQARWDADMLLIREALRALRDAALRAHGHYSETLSTNLGMWEQLT